MKDGIKGCQEQWADSIYAMEDSHIKMDAGCCVFSVRSKTFSSSCIKPKTSRRMLQADTWSLPPRHHTGIRTGTTGTGLIYDVSRASLYDCNGQAQFCRHVGKN